MLESAAHQPSSLWEEGVDAYSRDRLFLSARTVRRWQDRPVPPSLLAEIYTLANKGPTAANCQPLRIVYVASPQEKEALAACLDEGNVRQTRAAPVTAVLAYDLHFHERLVDLYPHQPRAREWFTRSPEETRDAAFRNASLQAGYFIMAARSVGLDCGPMGGFDVLAVTRRFFPQGGVEVNFLCNLGYGASSDTYQRLPRLAFDEACRVV